MDFIRLLRPHHYVKNLLIFVPVLTANAFTEINIGHSILTFFALSITCSAGYIFNDLLDKDHDKQIKYKQNRPLAAGNLSIQIAIFLCIFLFTLSIFVSFLTDIDLVLLIMGYFLLSLFYSGLLKRIFLIDLIALSSFYFYRVWIGGIMFDIQISFWLMVFSMFFFFSLSLVKRISELTHISKLDESLLHGRAYSRNHLDILSQLAIASSLISVLVFFLYIDFANSINQYENYSPLVILNLIIFLWFFRIFNLAKFNRIGSDPIAFAIKDPKSIFLLLISLAMFFLSNFKF